MTRTEAQQHIINHGPKNVIVGPVTCSHNDQDDVTTWSTYIKDPETDDVIGHSTFDEHYGEVETTWT